jgi:glycosyltransferase involved in cell wall biosynthesis
MASKPGQWISMRILHILASDSSNAQDARFLDMIRAFAALNIEQYAIIKTDEQLSDILESESIPFIELKLGGMFDLRSQKDLQKIVSSFSPHIIQTHTVSSAGFAKDADKSIPHIGFAGTKEDNDKMRILCSALLSTSANKQQEDEIIFHVPPLIMTDEIEAESIDRSEYNAPADKLILGSVCTLGEKTGLDRIFQAIREISQLHYWILGQGEKEKYFKELADKRAVSDRVQFITNKTQQGKFLNSIDILIIPQGTDDPNKLVLSAWAYKKPVIFVGKFEDSIITNKENGIATGSDNTLKIREDLNSILESDELKAALIESGFKTYTEQYEYKSVVKKYLKAYEQALIL